MKKFKLLLFLFLLCGFSETNYNTETFFIKETEYKFYAPKNFCRYEYNENAEEIIKKISNTTDFISFLYVKCDEIEKYRKNEIVSFTEELKINVGSSGKYIGFNKKENLKNFTNNYKTDVKFLNNTVHNELKNANFDNEAKGYNLDENEIKSVRSNYQQSLEFSSSGTDRDYKVIDDIPFQYANYVLNGKEYYLNYYDGTLNNVVFNLQYKTTDKNSSLANINNFAEYFFALQKLNEIPKTYYIKNDVGILKIDNPDEEKFFDASKISFHNIPNDFHKKYLEYSDKNNDKNKIVIAIKPVSPRENLNDIYNNMKNSGAIFKNEAALPYILYYEESNGIQTPIYFYIIEINGVNIVINSTIINQNNDLNISKEKELKFITEKYLEHLKQINI